MTILALSSPWILNVNFPIPSLLGRYTLDDKMVVVIKKIPSAVVALLLILMPSVMGITFFVDQAIEGATICVSDCFEETALTSSRTNDLQDNDILPTPSLPVLIATSIGFFSFLSYLYVSSLFKRDSLSYFCAYLE